ncbi:unnamed protein product [Oppiella nova]|uniref:glutathione transferase n=1 Tax=Oppiella nova TaxID=334625 RepID=A0A7R9MK20_9ACAR|nr:unnamed protein product [Oppiella nova]CAG2178597.1 unnamed protein product [Oppiella nova]
MSTKPSIGYWDNRGKAQSIRYLLKYAGVDFNDKRYEKAHKDIWFTAKPNLGLDFPNIPYYMDGDIKLSQSVAIMRYLARKHGLVARDDPTLARQEMVEQQLEDMFMGFMMTLKNTVDNDAKWKDYCAGTLKQQLTLLVKFLGDKQWLTGQLAYVDFLAYEILDAMRAYVPPVVDECLAIKQYLDRFEALPPIKAYRSSSEFMSWPMAGIPFKRQFWV